MKARFRYLFHFAQGTKRGDILTTSCRFPRRQPRSWNPVGSRFGARPVRSLALGGPLALFVSLLLVGCKQEVVVVERGLEVEEIEIVQEASLMGDEVSADEATGLSDSERLAGVLPPELVEALPSLRSQRLSDFGSGFVRYSVPRSAEQVRTEVASALRSAGFVEDGESRYGLDGHWLEVVFDSSGDLSKGPTAVTYRFGL